MNKCLYKGPKFHQLILDLLIRFRSYKVALIVNVDKTFLMSAVNEKDWDVLQFIWVDDVAKEEPELCVYRFTRVVCGVSVIYPFFTQHNCEVPLGVVSRFK